MIGVLVARVRKGDDRRLRLAENMEEFAAEVGAVVRDLAADGLRIRRLARTGGRRGLGVIAPPVAMEQLLEAAIRKAEELEADARALSGARVQRFLEECSLPAAAITDALERAREIVAEFDTAVLAVDLAPAGATVIVTPPESSTRDAAQGQYHKPAVPLLRALPET